MKKNLEKMSTKKVVEEVIVGENESPSEFDEAFDADYSVPLQKVHSKPKGEPSSDVLRITTILTALMDRLERVENKVDQVKERLSLVNESCSASTAVVERTDARFVESRSLVK